MFVVVVVLCKFCVDCWYDGSEFVMVGLCSLVFFYVLLFMLIV